MAGGAMAPHEMHAFHIIGTISVPEGIN